MSIDMEGMQFVAERSDRINAMLRLAGDEHAPIYLASLYIICGMDDLTFGRMVANDPYANPTAILNEIEAAFRAVGVQVTKT
jgi:predicted metal-dependent phosphotriesterase family hydrolase